jgi:hypothetical protein
MLMGGNMHPPALKCQRLSRAHAFRDNVVLFQDSAVKTVYDPPGRR